MYKQKSKSNKCSSRNPDPPCLDGFYPKMNPKGNLCCYKQKSSAALQTKKKELDLRRKEFKEREELALKKKKEFEDMLAIQDIQHKENMDRIIYLENQPRRQVLTKWNPRQLKDLANHYIQHSSHVPGAFDIKGVKTKKDLIEKIIEFENSIDKDPRFQYGKSGRRNIKRTRKHRQKK